MFHALVQTIRARRPGENITHTTLRQLVAAYQEQHPEALAADIAGYAEELDGSFNISADRVYAGGDAIVIAAAVLQAPIRVLFLNTDTYNEWNVPVEGVAPIDNEPLNYCVRKHSL